MVKCYVSQNKLDKIYQIIWDLQKQVFEPITKKQVRNVIIGLSNSPKNTFPKSLYAIDRLISRAFGKLVELGWIIKVKQKGAKYSVQGIKLWKSDLPPYFIVYVICYDKKYSELQKRRIEKYLNLSVSIGKVTR